jgi:uncharacterized short protein YbdD (DUF466 family)
MISSVVRLAGALRFILGVPSYRHYLEHMAAHHPGQPVMSHSAFFNSRQRARYGGQGSGRCC